LRFHRLFIVFVFAHCVVSACAGTDVGNPASEVSVEFLASEATPGGGPVILSNGYTVHQAWLVVAGITIRNGEQCDDAHEFYLPGPIAIDLLAPQPSARLSAKLPMRNVCKFSLHFGALEATSPGLPTPAELLDQTLFFRVSAPGRPPQSVVIARNETVHILLNNASVALQPDHNYLAFALSLEEWFSDQILASLERVDPSDPESDTTSTSNAVAAQICSNVKRSLKLYRTPTPEASLAAAEYLGTMDF